MILSAGAQLKSHSIYDDYDMDTSVGTVVQNPKNPAMWGIRNEDKANWTYEKADGTQLPVAPGRTAGIALGIRINFGECLGSIE